MMSVNLVSKILIGTAIASLTLLTIGTHPLKADIASETITSASDRLPCRTTFSSTLRERQSQQWMAGFSDRKTIKQEWNGSNGWGYRSGYGRMYNLNTVETIAGEVISVDKFTPMAGMSQGVHMQLKTENETIDVHLGPAWYLDNQDMTIAPKDRVSVKGSRITWGGETVLVAAEVQKDNATLVLRDASGVPLWRSWQ